jgi:glycine dehydrogenase
VVVDILVCCIGHVFFVADSVHPQTIGVIKTRAEPMDIKVVVGSPLLHDFASNPVSGALLQYPDTLGGVHDYSSVIQSLHASGGLAGMHIDEVPTRFT